MSYGKWEGQFNRQIAATLKVTSKIQVEGAKILLSRIEKRTPIGRPELWKYPAPKNYVPGTLRASWAMLITSALNIQISNDQPYADRVEFGWSTQAPAGMLRISIKEWDSIINKLVAQNKI